MDKQTAISLLNEADATSQAWEIADDSVHGTWGILVPIGHEKIYWVASGRMPPTRPEARLLAAAPDLARWGIEQANEVESLHAEVQALRALVEHRTLGGKE